jgi:homospermidine synthase
MTDWTKHVAFKGPVVMIGFGSIGKGSLPLILRHIDLDARGRGPRNRRGDGRHLHPAGHHA